MEDFNSLKQYRQLLNCIKAKKQRSKITLIREYAQTENVKCKAPLDIKYPSNQ